MNKDPVGTPPIHHEHSALESSLTAQLGDDHYQMVSDGDNQLSNDDREAIHQLCHLPCHCCPNIPGSLWT